MVSSDINVCLIVPNSSCQVISKSDYEWLFAILASEKLYCFVNNLYYCFNGFSPNQKS